MARPKLIEDSVLLSLIKKYFDEECNNDIRKLKASEITRYINAHGYPDYPATTLRRTKVATEYIESLKQITGNEHYVTVSTYQTIDAAALVETNRTKDRLISAITERDLYYKRIADSAAYHFEKYNKLQEEYDAEKESNFLLRKKIEQLEEQVLRYKAEIKQLMSELKVANAVIDTYVYPEIANELLEKEGAVRKTERLLKDNVLENRIITPTTDIKPASKSGSNVVKGLFNL